MELKRLGKENYDELINLMNYVFGRKNKREMSFEHELPSMCQRTDEAMRKHFGIFEQGILVAALGVYPLPCKINGESFLFSTVGNVAVHPDFEGRGYMGIMMSEAMKELERIGADASRLGGARQRYNRYGFESAGVSHTFTLLDHNIKHTFGQIDGFTFEKVERSDTGALLYINSLHKRQEIFAERSEERDAFGVFAAATAWRATPYIVKENGKRIGYLSAGHDLCTVAELYPENPSDFARILAAYARFAELSSVTTSLADYETDAVRELSAICATSSTGPVCHFKLINFAKITDALMRLKATYRDMPKGEFLLGIEGYGTLKLFSDGKNAGACLCDEVPEITLDKLTATRFLFGHAPASLIAKIPPHLALWLPLPLFWNLQDRV